MHFLQSNFRFTNHERCCLAARFIGDESSLVGIITRKSSSEKNLLGWGYSKGSGCRIGVHTNFVAIDDRKGAPFMTLKRSKNLSTLPKENNRFLIKIPSQWLVAIEISGRVAQSHWLWLFKWFGLSKLLILIQNFGRIETLDREKPALLL